MAVTIAEICDAIETTLSTGTGIVRHQSYNELTEGINAGDLPLLQVYFESLGIDPEGRTDRTAFKGGLRNKPITIHADVYVSQLAHIGQGNKALVNMVDTLIDKIETQNEKPYFGEDDIKSFSIPSIQRATVKYASADYVMARFTFIVWVY